jgi:hypothetical protein
MSRRSHHRQAGIAGRGLATLGQLVACVACSPTLPAPEVHAPAQARETEQAHLLLYPEPDGASLLGRAVRITEDGGWTIADGRSPGCEVEIRRERSQFRATRALDMRKLTTLAGGYEKVLSLEAKFGHTNSAAIDVANSEILRADMRGPCGDVVIDTVFVGRGSRSISAAAEVGGKGSVQLGLVTAAPSAEAATRIVDAVAWSDDQAYGFSFRKNQDEPSLDLEITVPSIVSDGDEVDIRLRSTRAVWVVVYYLDADGRADVLWPSSEEPEPHLVPGETLVLPSAKERALGFKLKALLAEPKQRSRETLVVYGFTDKRDFDVLKPSKGRGDANGAALAAELTKRLQALPMSRWTRSVLTYVVEPRPDK